MRFEGRRSLPFLVLAHLDDRTALLVAAELQRRHGTSAVRVVAPEELALARTFSLRTGSRTDDSLVVLADGTRLAPATLGVVLDRLRFAPAGALAGASLDDREYAAMELSALWVAWLESLAPRVVNPPVPVGLGVHRTSLAGWLGAAARCGLPISPLAIETDPRQFAAARRTTRAGRAPFRLVSADMGELEPEPVPTHLLGREATTWLEVAGRRRLRVVIAGDRLIGPAPEELSERLRRFAHASGLPLCEIELSSPCCDGSEWQVSMVRSCAHARSHDELRAIVDLLEHRAASNAEELT